MKMDVFIYDWTTKNNELIAYAMENDKKYALRLSPKYFFFILPAENQSVPPPSEDSVSLKSTKSITIFGYQDSPTHDTILVMSDSQKDLNAYKSSLFRLNIKLAEDDISIARKLTALKHLQFCPYISLDRKSLVSVSDSQKITRSSFTEYKYDWTKLVASEPVKIDGVIKKFNLMDLDDMK